VPPEGIVADGGIILGAEPVWQWPVLPLLLGEALFYQQGFLGSHYSNILIIN
jgi:hypothetical protein